MNITSLILIALLGLIAALFLPALVAPPKQSWRSLRRARVRRFSLLERLARPFVMAISVLASRFHRAVGGNRIALANTILTYPECGDTALADEAIGRYKLIKKGTDIYHKGLCDKGDIPEGFTRDSSASGAEERFAFDYFGLARKGSEATASGTCTAGNLCCPGDDGTIRDITQVSSETVYVCGKLMTTATTGNQVVFIPYAPTKLVIA
jgi:hypothetical protein